MKQIDFTEKVILVLGFMVEIVAILMLFSILTSCKVKKQDESKLSEKTEVSLNVKTNETSSDSTVNVVRNLVIESINRDFYAMLQFLNFSDPDSLGRQYITGAATVNLSDKSKIDRKSETVDSIINKASTSKITEDNLKVKDELKTETKTKSEVDSKGWTGFFWIIGIGFLIGLAVFIFKKLK